MVSSGHRARQNGARLAVVVLSRWAKGERSGRVAGWVDISRAEDPENNIWTFIISSTSLHSSIDIVNVLH